MNIFKRTLIAIPLLLSSTFAFAVPVDSELSLVIDVSGSVSASEYNLMMDGYGAAFRDASIQANILSGTAGAIAVNAIFFDSSAYTTTLDTFVLLDSVAAINSFAAVLEGFTRPGSGGTSVYTGMNKANSLLVADNGFESSRLVMDVSGDGTSTASTTQAARDSAAAAGITVNGITIGSTSINDFYNANVITTDGFSIHATNFDGFAAGVKQKLQIETGGTVPEPATLLLLSAGLVGMGAARRRRSKNA